MNKTKRKNAALIFSCLVIMISGCESDHTVKVKEDDTEYVEIRAEQAEVTIQETEEKNKIEVFSEDSSQESDIDSTEELSYPYDYLEVDDPRAQKIIAAGWGEGFLTSIPIRGLVGYTPISNKWGGLASYHKDQEILIQENIGKGLFQSDKLTVVKEDMADMFKDIIWNRGNNVEDYQMFFSDSGMLEQLNVFLNNDIGEEWILLESFYLSDYAGNQDEFWWDGLNSETLRLVETEYFYNFQFIFFADYRTMGYGEDEEASNICISCAVSKESGLIEELGLNQWNISRNGFEISRW